MKKTLQEQCAERRIEREAIRAMAKRLERTAERRKRSQEKAVRLLVKGIEHSQVKQALARLPKSASFALQRQVIREIMEP